MAEGDTGVGASTAVKERVSVLYCVELYICRRSIGAKYQTQHLQPTDCLCKCVVAIIETIGLAWWNCHGEGKKPLKMHHRSY